MLRVGISAGPLPGNCHGQTALIRMCLCHEAVGPDNLVPADGWWRSSAGKVTAGLAESNGSLPPGVWLKVTCGLTACTPASAQGQTLGNEYGRTLTLPLLGRIHNLSFCVTCVPVPPTIPVHFYRRAEVQERRSIATQGSLTTDHSNLWSRYDLNVVGQRGVRVWSGRSLELYCGRLSEGDRISVQYEQ